MVDQTPLHIATARPVGLACQQWAAAQGYNLVGMDDCEVFVSVLYDKVLPASYLDAKSTLNGRPRRCYNFHPGILPQYRGAGAFSWAIINGEQLTGVTLHEIDGDIDHGPIISQYAIAIDSKSTAVSLFNEACEHTIPYMFRYYLPRLLIGAYKSTPQDESLARYYPRAALESAKDLTRFARAFHFPGKEQAWYKRADGTAVYLDYQSTDQLAAFNDDQLMAALRSRGYDVTDPHE